MNNFHQTNSTIFMKKIAISKLLVISIFISKNVFSQDPICKTWLTEQGSSKVRIYLATDGKYYGKIVWLRDSLYKGRPMIDTENPDKSKRNNSWLGIQLISGLTKKSDIEYVNGQIYDPTKGHYYNCKMTVEGDKLVLRGYILGLPFLGRTTTWSLVE